MAELEIRLQEQRALAERSARLQSLLDLKAFVSAPTLAADVIAGYVNPGILTVTIDRGSDDGVMPDMAVISSAGVVGRVIGPVAAHAARVQLLIDHNGPAAAAAITERTRAGGMVVGKEGDPPLRMDFVSNLADVKAGRRRRHVGRRRDLPARFPRRMGGEVRARRRAVAGDHRAAGRGFSRPRGGAGRAPAGARRDARGVGGAGRARSMKAAGVLLALVVALALQTTLSGLTITGARMVNLVVVAVVYVALMYGPVTGLMAGTAGGLAQDALAGGIVGIGSLSKTIVGFLAGLLGAQFIVAQPFPRLVMFISATVLHEVCYQGLFALIEIRPLRLSYSAGADPGGDQRNCRADGIFRRRAPARAAAEAAGPQRPILEWSHVTCYVLRCYVRRAVRARATYVHARQHVARSTSEHVARAST